MKLYSLSNGKTICPCGRGLRYVGGMRSSQKGAGAMGSLLLSPGLGSNQSGAGLVGTIQPQSAVIPIKDTTGLQQKLAGLNKMKIKGKRTYANL